MNRLKLLGIFIKREISGNKLVTLFSVFSVALGIALFFSINVSINNAVSKFETDMEKSNPQYKFQVLPLSGTHLNEELYKILPHDSFPVIEVKGEINGSGRLFTVMGIDIFKNRGLTSKNSPLKAEEINLFLTAGNRFICSKKTAEKMKLKENSPVYFTVADKNYTLYPIVSDSEEYHYTDILVMDIGNVQEIFNLNGRLSKIYLKNDNFDIDLKTYNSQIIPTEKIITNKTEIVSSFTYNLRFIGFIGMLAGFFLLYNSMFVTSVKRRKDTGILKSLGASNLNIILYYTFYSVVIGFLGSLAGIGIGYVFSGFTSLLTSATISTIYNTIIENSSLISSMDILYAILTGVLLTAVSVLIPAFEAVTVRTVDVLKEGSSENRYRFYYKPLFFIGLFIISSGVFMNIYQYFHPVSNIPFYSYAGVFAILLGFIFISPFFILIVLKFIKKLFEQSFKARGNIVMEFISGNIYRYASGVVSVFIAAALIISMNIMIHSFKKSLTLWIEENINADIYIKPFSCTTNFCFEPIESNIRNSLSKIASIENINYFRVFPGKYQNRSVLFGFGDVNTVARYRKTAVTDINLNSVAVSEFIEIKYGIKPGDIIEITTPGGKKRFPVREVFTSYSTTGGFIIFDRSVLKKYWDEDKFNQVSIFLKKGEDLQKSKLLIKETLNNNLISITDREQLKNQILEIFDKTFLITYGIQMVAFIISLIGVISTIIASVYEKKREISILNFLGTTRKDFKSIFSGISLFIGCSGVFLGIILGGFLSILLIQVVNRISFGWSIKIFIPLPGIIFVSVFLLLIIVLIGNLSSYLVKIVDSKKNISSE